MRRNESFRQGRNRTRKTRRGAQRSSLGSGLTDMNRYKYIDEKRSHLHTLDGKPLIGTSTVAKESVNKGDGLMQWYADLATLDALGKAIDPEEYKGLLIGYEMAQSIQDWKAKSNAMKNLDKQYPFFSEARRAAIRKRDGSASAGTLRHGVLEEYIRDCIKQGGHPQAQESVDDGLYEPAVREFIIWAHANVAKFVFTEANCFSEKLWLGGISDIGMILKDGRRVLGDHKSSKNAFFDQFIQCALYDIELAENGILDADGNKKSEWELADGYVVFPFRSSPFTPEFKWNVGEYRSVAEGVVRTYKLKEYDHV